MPSNVPGSSQDRPSIAPGSPQDRPRVPQDAKVEAPSMPNDTHGYQNPPKINKNQGLDLKVLFCCLLCSPMSQNWPRVPQHAKVKQPIMPNDRFASQKYHDPLATLPRICNPETMSNDRGPAAEIVAHKIKNQIKLLPSRFPLNFNMRPHSSWLSSIISSGNKYVISSLHDVLIDASFYEWINSSRTHKDSTHQSMNQSIN